MVMDSRTSQEVRGLKPHPRSCKQVFHRRRTSQEVRGLKRPLPYGTYMRHASHLARGAWIETYRALARCKRNVGRTSQEVRGLKRSCRLALDTRGRVAPRKRCVD